MSHRAVVTQNTEIGLKQVTLSSHVSVLIYRSGEDSDEVRSNRGTWSFFSAYATFCIRVIFFPFSELYLVLEVNVLNITQDDPLN